MDVQSTTCCGVGELISIEVCESAKEVLQLFCEQLNEWDKLLPIYLFTGVLEDRYAENLMRYIRKHNLGAVRRSNARVNPNTENTIVAYLWEVNKRNLRAWRKKNKNNE